jgi:hypothetical protein
MNCDSDASAVRVFSTKDPGESVILTFDFTNGLGVGELLSGVITATTVDVVVGEDLAPSTIIFSPASVNTLPLPQNTGVPIATSKAVQLGVGGGVLGAVYNITVFAQTTSSTSQVLACSGELKIQKA